MDLMEIGDCAEEEIFGIDSDSQYAKFDSTIGHIEDIVMSDDFQEIQNNFFNKYSHEFDDSEENKFIYTDIHKEYTQTIESFLVEKLKETMTDFSMDEFLGELSSKKLDMDGEIFEILFSFTNFLVFKDMMVGFRKSKENPLGPFDDLVCVTPINRDPGALRDEGGPTPGHTKDPSLGLRLAGMSLRRGSMSSNPVPVCELVPKMEDSSRQNPPKCPKKASISFHQPHDSKKSKTRKVANNPVPSTSKSEDLDSTKLGTRQKRRN